MERDAFKELEEAMISASYSRRERNKIMSDYNSPGGDMESNTGTNS